jgi:hypothetical protein
MDEATGVFLHVAGIAEPVTAGERYCSETGYVGSSRIPLADVNGESCFFTWCAVSEQ